MVMMMMMMMMMMTVMMMMIYKLPQEPIAILGFILFVSIIVIVIIVIITITIATSSWKYASVASLMTSSTGPEGYPRVLDYSIFQTLLVPYSKNFTTHLSSRVVTTSTFSAQTLKYPDMTNDNHQKSCILCFFLAMLVALHALYTAESRWFIVSN